VPEQLRFKQRIRQAGTVQGDEWCRGAGTPVVDQPGDDLLADPCFACYQDLRIGAGGNVASASICGSLLFPQPDFSLPSITT
jgi:hypothetical protein